MVYIWVKLVNFCLQLISGKRCVPLVFPGLD
jgi:hypothetical protein